MGKSFQRSMDLRLFNMIYINFCLKEMTEYGERRCASDEELFATAYHKLVHSPALETMLQLEHTYALTVKEKCEEKDKQINELSNR